MSGDLTPMAFRWTIVPGNNEFVIPLDSTRGPDGLSYAALAAGSSFLAPGRRRGLWAGRGAAYSILVTGQNVTVEEQTLTGNAGTSADWATQGVSPSYTAVAGVVNHRGFKPLGPDYRILVAAGGTGPTTVVVWGNIPWIKDIAP